MNDLHASESSECALHFDGPPHALEDVVISNRLRRDAGFLH